MQKLTENCGEIYEDLRPRKEEVTAKFLLQNLPSPLQAVQISFHLGISQ